MTPVFYFAWVSSSDGVFDPILFAREDEDILTAIIDHSEGQFPSLTIEVRNPRIGLLAPGRETWAWYSWLNPETMHVEPLFFGRLVGIPNDLFEETLTLQFLAQSEDYLGQKHVIADGLKNRPNYDPIFIDPTRRGDPDTILEGYSALWHYDRLDLSVSVSDIIDGEDGLETFIEDEVPRESVKMQIGQQPLQAVTVDATVTWTQQARGFVEIGQRSFVTYTGRSLISDWPKSGQVLDSGWSVAAAHAYDATGINTAFIYNYQFSWKSKAEKHEVGDTIAIEISLDVPIFGLAPPGSLVGGRSQGGTEVQLLVQEQVSIINPHDPDFHDIPTGWVRVTSQLIPLWAVHTALVLRYDASRPRTEHLVFTLMANMQPVLTPPTSPPRPNEEIISLSGTNVGEPLANIQNWLSVRGEPVSFGQVIYPALPTELGGTVLQICTTAGVAGLVEPEWSHIAGTQTVDGTVVWTSMGQQINIQVPDWQPTTYYPVGTIIRPLVPIYASWQSLVPLPRLQGVPVTRGQIIKGSSGAYAICSVPGVTGKVEPFIPTTYGQTVDDNQVTWVSLGTALPTGVNYFIATVAGVSHEFLPPHWDNTPDSNTTDNTVTWRSLGTAGAFIDLPIGDLSRRSYYPVDRGLWSLEYLLCRARARLRMSARAVKVSFDCSFARAANLSCRKMAKLFDPRIPGGEATGKVTNYQLIVDGDAKTMIGKVTMECAVGYGGMVNSVPGTPTYVEENYVDDYQHYDGATVPIAGSEVGYTIPIDAPNDDGLVFPLDKAQAVVVEQVWGSLVEQEAKIAEAAARARRQVQFALQAPGDVNAAIEAMRLARDTFESDLAGAPIWYELGLRPVTNGPFNSEYHIMVTDLHIPKHIDLEAPSTP